MKNNMLVWLLALMMLLLPGCGRTGRDLPTSGTAELATLTGTVMEVRENSLLVEGETGGNDLYDVTLPEGSGSGWKVGMAVEVIFDGAILESYPAQLGRVYSVTMVETPDGDGESTSADGVTMSIVRKA